MNWSDEQKSTAETKFGSVVDYPFPAVNPYASPEEILADAEIISDKIASQIPDAVLCQGEFSLSFEVTAILLSKGIKVVCACSEREVDEETDENGTTKKTVKFRFAGFREYLLPASI